MVANLLLGITLGFGAGISPGPMLVLVISSTLQKGFRAGLRVALAPLASDAPIILISLLVLPALAETWLKPLTLAGGLFLVYLGAETIFNAHHLTRLHGEPVNASPDFLRAVTANLLNPHPWLFWMTVGGPIVMRAWQAQPSQALAFGAGFYAFLVGSKIGIAWLLAHTRSWLSVWWYKTLLVLCGILLAAVGVLLIAGALVNRT